MEPILDLLAEHTGWKFSLVAGGPEPAEGGRLSMLGYAYVHCHYVSVAKSIFPSVHSGTTRGAVKMDFGRSERGAFRDLIAPTFARFLRKCYSRFKSFPFSVISIDCPLFPAIQECREQALPENSEFSGLAGAEEHEGVEVFKLDYGKSYEDEYVKMAPPRASAGSASSSKATPNSHTSAKPSDGTTSVPPPIRFGPPKSTKKPAGGDVSSNDHSNTPPPAPSSAQQGTVRILRGGSVSSSRGPSPPVSRPTTPDQGPMGPPTAGISVTAPSSSQPLACPLPLAPTSAQTESRSAPPSLPNPPSTLSAQSHDVQREPTSAASPLTLKPPGTMPPASVSTVSTTFDAANAAEDVAMNPLPAHSPTHGTAATPGATTPPQPSSPHACVSAQPIPETRISLPAPPGSVSVPDLRTSVAEEEVGKKVRKRKGATLTAGPRSKKRKATNESTHGSIIIPQSAAAALAGPDAPDWAIESLELFKSSSLGAEWDALVDSWLRFEQNSSFQGSKKLGHKSRPQAIAEWIKLARSATFRPKIKNVKTFSSEFTAWWASLQPGWRTKDADGNWIQDSGVDWNDLRCPGKNGLLSVVAALFFWGRAVQTSRSAARYTWENAMNDVLYVYTQLI